MSILTEETYKFRSGWVEVKYSMINYDGSRYYILSIRDQPRDKDIYDQNYKIAEWVVSKSFWNSYGVDYKVFIPFRFKPLKYSFSME